MATDWPNTAQSGMREQVDALRQRGVLSPRSIRRMAVTNSGGSDRMTQGYEGIAGQPEMVARRPRFTAGNELQLMRSEFGQDYQDLARAHMADDATEAAFQRFNSAQYGDKRMSRDEGDHRNRGAVPYDHVDAKQHQAGGRMSKGGSAGPERGQDAQHIDGNRNSRAQPQESTVRASNRNTRLRDGEHWLAHYATRAQARPKQSNEYYRDEQGWLSGDGPYRQERV